MKPSLLLASIFAWTIVGGTPFELWMVSDALAEHDLPEQKTLIGDGSPEQPPESSHVGAVTVNVRSFGAIPDDGTCDIAAINRAIRVAEPGTVLVFEAGTYNLFQENGDGSALIRIEGKSALTIRGQTDSNGRPKTKFEMNVKELMNDLDTAMTVAVLSSSGIAIENVVSDNKPAFATAGRAVTVDTDADVVEVEIFEGMPHFEGMDCYSANAWDLDTRDMKVVPALTIGANPDRFLHKWERVPGGNLRLYRIRDMGFSKHVAVGDGVSWHFYVRNRGWQFYISDSANVRMQNVKIDNAKGVAILAKSSSDLTFIGIDTRPVEPALAVGARDAFHLVCNNGNLLIEDSYIKGYRWDPINIKAKFCEVLEVSGPRKLRCEVRTASDLPKMTGRGVVFWAGEEPFVAKVVAEEWMDGVTRRESYLGNLPYRVFELEFAEDLPDQVSAGTLFTPRAWMFDSAVIRNTEFEGNYGRAILYQGENLLVSGCRFRNNAYADIALGPVEILEGGFVRNAVIENCEFERSNWIPKSNVDLPGNISVFSNVKDEFGNAAYNTDIVIRDNRFQHIYQTAIDLTHAQRVQLSGNIFEECPNTVGIEELSTQNVDHD